MNETKVRYMAKEYPISNQKATRLTNQVIEHLENPEIYE